MKRLILRWAAMLVFVLALAGLFVRLGEWQLHRHDARVDNNAHVAANQTQPVKGYAEVMTGSLQRTDEFQRVAVSGIYDAEHQIIVRYRNQADRPGAELLTPLKTSAGDWVIVNRGFIPRKSGELDPTVIPAPPTGTVTVTGYVRVNEVAKDNATVPVENRVRAIDSSAIGRTLGISTVNGYVALIESVPGQTGDMEPIALPVLDQGPHFWYAVQWFCFTLIALGGFVILIRGDLRDRRKRLALEAKTATEASGAEE